MSAYREMNRDSIGAELSSLRRRYQQMQQKGLMLNISRGKPGADQLDLSRGLLSVISESDSLLAEDGTDCGNYGVLEGIPEAKRLMADILELEPEEVIVGGSSSLNLMHDCVSIGYLFGYPGGTGGWGKEENIKFLCPSPGYDRHFSVTEHFGFELVVVPMNAGGPDMDVVEHLVQDKSVKGIWCVPKYSNPEGKTFSDETVRRLAAISPMAPDFRVFWDNAYAVHDLFPSEPDTLLSLMAELKSNGRQDMALMFTSTSKVTFPGGGISAIGASRANIAWLKKHFAPQVIGYDKINMLRHAKFLPDLEAVKKHKAKHAAILRPKFDAVLKTLDKELSGLEIASWTQPRGGYFISLDVMDGCAKRVVELCKEAGLILTGSGATYPYGMDPRDANIRIAPSFATADEVKTASELLALCVRLAAAEKLQAE
ncbi:MAG: aminotransferase class I/II-fold pyridoxal phosphate-dependent enzyme [Oscillospiraceae bacterium]|jgi:aspartate/methionine/tyrosine aminotransferase|nr:aminotransferase class I/II-fold pyridoxal phosphate-dependent enzyme [Oscillospiraceae bacterium]